MKALQPSWPSEVKSVIETLRSKNWAGLAPDSRAFAVAYLKSYSHIQAARDIGKPGRGLDYIRDPLVSAFIQDLQQDFDEYNFITANWVRQKWVELIPKLMGEEAVPVITSHGEEVKAHKFHSSESIAALRELSKSTKFYADGSAPPGAGGVQVVINMGNMLSGADTSTEGFVIEGDPDVEH